METINKIGFGLSFLFIWTTVLIYPSLHKILRNKRTFRVLLIISILLPIVSFLSYNEKIIWNEHTVHFYSFQLLIFLVLYKYYDNYIIKKHNRHIYFFTKYNRVLWTDEESDLITSTEFWLQYSLLLVPLIGSALFNWLILEILKKYCC